FLPLYGTNNPQADLDGSGNVNHIDASIILSKIAGNYTPPTTPNPSATPFPLYNKLTEKVPDFCTTGLVPGGGSIVTTTKSGNWSDPSVWSNGQVPNNIANGVQIQAGHTVTYDEQPSANVSISCVRIAYGGS